MFHKYLEVKLRNDFYKLDDTREQSVSALMTNCDKFLCASLSILPCKISLVTEIGCWLCCICDDSSKRTTAGKQRQKKKESKVKRLVTEYSHCCELELCMMHLLN